MTLSMSRRQTLAASLLATPALAPVARPANAQRITGLSDHVIHETVGSVMKKHRVPGMAVAVTVRGRRSLFNYGLACRETGRSVTQDTLFEIGSLSKTFTATLGGLAQARGHLALSDMASKILPALTESVFDKISLLHLATYTAGGLPLQVPDRVNDRDQMIAYFKQWQPAYAVGTRRLYSNVSMGLFGYCAGRSMGMPFDDLAERHLFPALGLTRTYVRVPDDQMGDYAFGYGKNDKPIRVRPGLLDSEAYGVKTTATDLIRFVEANIDGGVSDVALRRAIAATQTGYCKVGDMTQGLGWELYDWPTPIGRLLAGNSSAMSYTAHPVTWIARPTAQEQTRLINKTGSTNGFGSYVAFIPRKRLGVAILANRSFPVGDRVTAAYEILASLPGFKD